MFWHLFQDACQIALVGTMLFSMKSTSPHNSLRLKKQKGFTLVEILIVLALIGIVAGLAMSNLGEIFGLKFHLTYLNTQKRFIFEILQCANKGHFC